MLSEQDVTNFQSLFKKEFGIEISRDEALEEGLKLVSLMRNVYQPMTQEEHDEIEKHRRSTASELLKNVNNNKNEFERERS